MKISPKLHRPEAESTMVQLRMTVGGKRIKIQSGINVPTKAWDNKTKKIKPLNKSLVALQGELEEVINNIKKVHALMMVQELEITPLTFKDAIKRHKDGKEGVSEATLTFNQWVKEFIKETADGQRTNQLGLPIGHRTVQKYNTVKKHLDAFSKKVWGREIRFEEIDSRLLEQYKKYRGDQG
ncbi:MAG: phage integrase SAM-like domain-containing protein, partial [Flavobacteriales bacterium]|nr:phage integrase SAM-like domain-containing protein [Flavobacteriales bacterium]